MAASAASSFKRFNSSCKALLLCNDWRNTTEICKEREEDLRVSRSIKPKKKRDDDGGGNSKPDSSGCLGLHVKGSGCRVCSCEELGADVKTGLGSMEECMPRRVFVGVENTGVECFSYTMPERFWKKSVRKEKEIPQQPSSPSAMFSLPDDVLEMILVRVPLTSLMSARCVCKKWRDVTTAPQFTQLRINGSYSSPWLFLFGVMRNGGHVGEIHALDASEDRWHRIYTQKLKGKFLFSTASVSTDVFIVGGCSGSSNSIVSLEKGSFKTHKGVIIYSPLTGLWRKTTPMNSARSRPVLGVFEITPSCSILHSRTNKHDPLPYKSRLGAVSDVYEDPHCYSVRRQLRDAFLDDNDLPASKTEQQKLVGKEANKRPRLGLIAVGGHGCWDEPLNSGEIYDPRTGRWTEIAGLPVDFGAACSGAVCGQMFYVYSEADKLAAYNLEKGFWVGIQTSCPPPHLHDYSPRLVSSQAKLFMVCVSWCERDGLINRREKAVRKLFELDFALQRWAVVSRHPDAPMDRNAEFVADRGQIYGVEMFRIFGQVLDFLTVCPVSDTVVKWSSVTKKHAAHEADAVSCTTKSMVVLHL